CYSYYLHTAIPRLSPPPPSTLSLHDALPIFDARLDRPDPLDGGVRLLGEGGPVGLGPFPRRVVGDEDPRSVLAMGHGREIRARADRKSTRLNSSHVSISYAVFCLKKKR